MNKKTVTQCTKKHVHWHRLKTRQFGVTAFFLALYATGLMLTSMRTIPFAVGLPVTVAMFIMTFYMALRMDKMIP